MTKNLIIINKIIDVLDIKILMYVMQLILCTRYINEDKIQIYLFDLIKIQNNTVENLYKCFTQ